MNLHIAVRSGSDPNHKSDREKSDRTLMERIYGYIYSIKNKVNGMYYIGQTKFPEKRWRQHINASNSKRFNKAPLYQAIIKHGPDAFEYKIELRVETTNQEYKQTMDEYEKEYIKRFDCLVPNGYNRDAGGTGNPPNCKGRVHIHDPKTGRSRFVKREDIDKWLSQGYVYGYGLNMKMNVGKASKDRVFIHNPITGEKHFIKKDLIEPYIANGYVIGRGPY